MLLEEHTEGTDAFEADVVAYPAYGFIACGERMAGSIEAEIHQVLMRSETERLFERPKEMMGREECDLRNIGEAQLVVKIAVHITARSDQALAQLRPRSFTQCGQSVCCLDLLLCHAGK